MYMQWIKLELPSVQPYNIRVMRKIPANVRNRIFKLRKAGLSIPEINKETHVPITTIQRNVKGIEIPDEHRKRLREKQGGAKERARGMRENCASEAFSMLGTLSKRDRLILLLGIYWGEGTKKDFAMINSDPEMLQAFLVSLREVFGISQNNLGAGLRIHKGISETGARNYWSRALGIAPESFHRIEVVEGKKKGKLPYGMCRVRVRSGIRTRLLVQSMISIIGKDSAVKVLSR